MDINVSFGFRGRRFPGQERWLPGSSTMTLQGHQSVLLPVHRLIWFWSSVRLGLLIYLFIGLSVCLPGLLFVFHPPSLSPSPSALSLSVSVSLSLFLMCPNLSLPAAALPYFQTSAVFAFDSMFKENEYFSWQRNEGFHLMCLSLLLRRMRLRVWTYSTNIDAPWFWIFKGFFF